MAPVEESAGDPAVGVLPVSEQAQTGTQLDEPAHLDTDGVVPQHSLPQNWSRTRRWFIVLALSLTSLMVSMSLVICAPSSTAIAHEFQSHNALLLVFYITAPNLGQIFSSLYISPLSERFGRVHVYHLFNLLFLVLTLGTGFSTSLNMLIVLMALTGATIAPICLNPAITGDLFAVKKRGSAMLAASLIPIMGSAVGPIVGGYITQYWGWRWTFWVMAILRASVQPFLAMVLRETYLPVIRLVPTLSTTLCGFSLASSTTPIMTYLVDIFGDRSASAIAALLPLRYIVGTFLPVASPYMDSKLGYGRSYSLLALLLFIPIPPTFVMIIWPRDKKASMTVEQCIG
ncbi:major facilitator superfamily domain-containing protein [Diaporthe sp. PMI_573]|nr:major facilitator superfamily domain-containing protein [Diaporthaceae sp. PMI_573]